MLTPFGEKLDKNCPLNDYPRPLLQREKWQCLNGIWDYAVYPKGTQFNGYEGEIVVPFSPESILSGVGKLVMPDDVLYYRKKFTFHKEKPVTILHFGAVDYACIVRLNGRMVGEHRGGYMPFSMNVSKIIKEGENVLEVAVTDPSDTGRQAHGKQKIERGGIWYTPQSGIWQTVWLEQVCENYISTIHYDTDINQETVKIHVQFALHHECYIVDVFLADGGSIRVYAEDGDATVDLTRAFHLWSPENPYLYKVRISTSGGEAVESYFAMRKVSVKRIGEFYRICLNGKPYFQKGLLDQGYWSDGLYTAPSDEAMIYDIETMKKLGFNTLRKHIKIEPLRWYYHCDRLGMLVWQDLVSGGTLDAPVRKQYGGTYPAYERLTGHKKKTPRDTDLTSFARENEEERLEYYRDLADTVQLLHNQPSIVMWVAFNEGWGQFDALKAEKAIKALDKTRLVDHASGWYDQGGGDVNSIHDYSKKPIYPLYGKRDYRPIVLSEYGGLTAVPSVEHVFDPLKTSGYRRFGNAESCTEAFCRLQTRLSKDIAKKGLSACIYTQVSDVEEEMNGILTFDRKVIKVDVARVIAVNKLLKL